MSYLKIDNIDEVCSRKRSYVIMLLLVSVVAARGCSITHSLLIIDALVT